MAMARSAAALIAAALVLAPAVSAGGPRSETIRYNAADQARHAQWSSSAPISCPRAAGVVARSNRTSPINRAVLTTTRICPISC